MLINFASVCLNVLMRPYQDEPLMNDIEVALNLHLTALLIRVSEPILL